MVEQAEIKQYGMPNDCRGWRQFLLGKQCDGFGMPGVRKNAINQHLPMVVWVAPSDSAMAGWKTCRHEVYMIHPDSVSAIRTGLNTRVHEKALICEGCGSFIE